MKTLATFAFLAVMAVSVSGANASLAQEGKQNFYYYFGTPCPCPMPPLSGCGSNECAPVDPCCDDGFFKGILY